MATTIDKFRHETILTTGAQSWTVPDGVTKITAWLTGGGGKGGSFGGGDPGSGGGGGGSSGVLMVDLDVVPNEILSIYVGTSAGSASGTNDTWIKRGSTILAFNYGGGDGNNGVPGGSGTAGGAGGRPGGGIGAGAGGNGGAAVTDAGRTSGDSTYTRLSNNETFAGGVGSSGNANGGSGAGSPWGCGGVAGGNNGGGPTNTSSSGTTTGTEYGAGGGGVGHQGSNALTGAFGGQGRLDIFYYEPSL